MGTDGARRLAARAAGVVASLAACLGCAGGGGGTGGEGGADETPPAISDVGVAPAGTGKVVVTWTTDEPATSRVDYGPTEAYGWSAGLGAALATSHAVLLEDLGEGVVYHYRVTSADAAENEASSPDDTFDSASADGRAVEGTLASWHPVSVAFRGPAADELDDAPNPFLDLRMTLVLTGPSGQVLTVPGFFDGDGEGGGNGDVWRARFALDEGGTWSYVARLRAGPGIAVEIDPTAGTPTSFDGATGTFPLAGRDPEAPGFLRHGFLEHVGGHYLKFRDGPYFLKGGTDSPENLLGYAGFDNTFDQGGLFTGLVDGLHRYEPHVGDWTPTDPLFTSADTGYDSKGIIGALNYLSSKRVNSVYFLPMNLGGDGQETYPFVGPSKTAFHKTHYDVGKLHQWNVVFEHAQRKGILLHFVLAETETENETFLDGGAFGVERMLFFRELIARFGHNLAIKWNLSEENDFPVQTLEEMAAYIRALDPYDHPIAVHTHPDHFADYWPLLGNPHFTNTSIQYSPDQAGAYVEQWREQSAAAGHPWVIDMDENAPAGTGLTDSNADDLRKRVLYDVYFSGGQIEWYLGYHPLPLGGDVNTEDFRTREAMWEFMWHARKLMETYLPFWEMEPADELLTGESPAYGGGEVFAKHGEVYAVYLPSTEATGTLDLSGTSGTFLQFWYDPRTGAFAGTAVPVSGGGPVALGPPPGAVGEDWVVGFVRP